jgi:hypothetical protein
MKKEIRQALIEAKEKKERLLIEESLVKSRIMMIVESEDNIKNFDSLPKRKQKKIAEGILAEMVTVSEPGLLSEDFDIMGMLGSLFGNSWSGLLQMIGEPFVNSILSALGMQDGYFKNVLISFFTKNLGRLAKALRGDCQEITGLVAESLVEGIEMSLAQSHGMTGPGYSFIRNTLNASINDQAFIKHLEEQLESTVCSWFNGIGQKATDVVSKIKPSIDAAPAAVPAS